MQAARDSAWRILFEGLELGVGVCGVGRMDIYLVSFL